MAKSIKPADAFADAVERALEHVADPAWLGEHSPLAAPYFLGPALQAQTGVDTPAGRGAALRDLLQRAALSLSDDQKQLLNVSFFKRDAALNNTGVALKLGKPETTYYRHRITAITEVARELVSIVLPPFRLEPLPNAQTWRDIGGRGSTIVSGLETLRAGGSMSLVGPGGAGKTSLAAALAARWSPVFWFTLRPGLNDHLNGLVFALAHFLRVNGATTTWRQLIADQGVVKPEQVLGLLRNDFAALPLAPLICIDEADLLRRELRAHSQVIHILESLRGIAPLLIVGQRPVIDTTVQYDLGGLSESDVRVWLDGEQIRELSNIQISQLTAATRGNLGLLTLFGRLLRLGEPPGIALSQLSAAPSLELLFGRIWLRLSDEERAAMMALAVFRSPAPSDAWPDHAPLFEQLIARGLVLRDQAGAIWVLPVAREFVAHRTPSELRNHIHLRAAEIREARAEFTASAYHYIQAQQPAMAIWLWLAHQRREIALGHAPAAAELFHEISPQDLPTDDDRKSLAVLRAELLKMQGAAEDAETLLLTERWPASHPLSPRARQLLGDVLIQQGRVDQALENYREGLRSTVTSPQAQAIDFHNRIGYVHLALQPDLQLAREEALQAQQKAHGFAGNVEEEAGNYVQAKQHYERMLELAQRIKNNAVERGRSHTNLGRLSWKMGNLEEAIAHLEQAIQLERSVGNTVLPLFDYLNLSAAYIQAGRNEEALGQAQEALLVAESLKHSQLIAALAANASEACVYLGRLDEAERYAHRSLSQEEEVHRPYALTSLGLVQHARKQYAQAENTLKMAIDSARQIEDKFAEAPAWRALGRVRLEQDALVAAREAFDNAIALYTGLGLHSEVETTRLLTHN